MSFRTFATALGVAFVVQIALLMVVLPIISERFSSLYSVGFSETITTYSPSALPRAGAIGFFLTRRQP